MGAKVRMRQMTRAVPREGLDFYPTPPWATRALLHDVMPRLGLAVERDFVLWDPACGAGHMAYVLREYSDRVLASDIHDYGHGEVRDFFAVLSQPSDWIITNPPYNRATDFFLHALELRPRQGVAMLARLQLLEGKDRYARLFSQYVVHVAPFVERVGFNPGAWDPCRDRGVSAYAWFVWVPSRASSSIVWIPPGRRELTRDADSAWSAKV